VQIPELTSFNLNGQRVLIREDLNVPISEGEVSSDARIQAALPTLRYALDQGAKVIVMSHLGRPREGVPVADQPEVSLAPVARHLSRLTGYRVQLIDNYVDGFELPEADIVLLENVRVNRGEAANDDGLARKLAALCDIFVMDAFGTAHRAQASTAGITAFAPLACAGPLLTAELKALGKALQAPRQPVVAIVGGSKVSSKLEVLDALSEKVDALIVGGGIANTFLAASGVRVGRSLHEPALLDAARRIQAKVQVPLPVDVVVGNSLSPGGQARISPINAVRDDEMILDIGPQTQAKCSEIITPAGTIIWNGPVGVFELPAFSAGTRAIADTVARNEGFSIAGGGDTLAAIEQFGITDQVSYISTGGGAFLEFVEGKALPAVVALQARSSN
jgi:phosphoglycerate kinase